jgi:hypothetical protein
MVLTITKHVSIYNLTIHYLSPNVFVSLMFTDCLLMQIITNIISFIVF